MSFLRGGLFGAAALIGTTCWLTAASLAPEVWCSPPGIDSQVWSFAAGAAWFALAASVVWRLPRAFRVCVQVAFVLIAVSAALDVWRYYKLVQADAISTALAVPSSLAVVVLAVIAVRELRCVRSRSGRLVLRVLGAGSGALSACLLVLLTFGATDYRRSADCAIVLGAGVYADGSPSMALSDRVAESVALYHEGHVERLLMSGGVDPRHGQSESQIMKRLAIEAGVPAERISLDEDGVSTRASAENCATIMRAQQWESALLVSHDYHLLRAKAAFTREGARVFTVPASETRPMRKGPYYVLRECVAWLYYALPA